MLPSTFIDKIIAVTEAVKCKLAHNITSNVGSGDADITPQIITLRDVFKIADSMPDSIDNLVRVIYIVLCERQRSE